MWEYQREECRERRVQVGASLFCQCGMPFAGRYRHSPCHHVLCATCAFESNTSTIVCPVCNEHSEAINVIHPNDSLYICTVKGCNRGFLNFPSLRLHAHLEHNIEAESVVDFYSKTGDITIQFGDVHKISQEHAKDEEGSCQVETQINEVNEGGIKSASVRSVITAPKQARIAKIEQEKGKYDDLEELM